MKTSKNAPFAAMCNLSKKITLYHSIQLLLEWDQETYMPPESAKMRADQIELLSGFIHKQKTSPSFKKALSKLCDLASGEPHEKNLPLAERSMIRLWHREWLQNTKLPASFVRQEARANSSSLPAWHKAKQASDFQIFAPHLQKIVNLCQKKANLLGFKEHPYDALLDLYEPGMTTAQITPLFAELKTSLVHLLQKIKASSQKTPAHTGSFDPDTQMKVGKELLKKIGFSEENSRLDLSSHPFCTEIHPSDIRMTTRIFKENLTSHLLSVLHEAGHALYHAQLPQEFYGTPVCGPVSYGVNESQSRLLETLIGKNKPFWKFFYPTIQKAFPDQLGSLSVSDFYKQINTVSPSFIRVEADEVTYSLHIILRFEIEKALMEGSLKVKDLPRVWNEKMQELLGITPPNDKLGCLQDIHWTFGGIGYFPTYTLGNMLAAQLYETMKQENPSLEKQIEEGDFHPFREWLKENIHQKGHLYEAKDLILAVTKKPLSPKAYIDYLQRKYQELYP